MLSKKISIDNNMLVIDSEAGPYGVIFWTWLIAHLDREGRQHGDPDVLKGTVAPRIPAVTLPVICRTIAAACRLEMLVQYEVDGDLFIHAPNFHKNQPGLRQDREPESDFPPPEQGVIIDHSCRQVADNVPEDCRQDDGQMTGEGKGREGNRREGKGRESVTLSPTKIAPVDLTPKVEVSSLVGDVVDIYTRRWPKRLAGAQHPDTRKIIRQRLAQGYTVDDMAMAIKGNAESDYHSKRSLHDLDAILDRKRIDTFIAQAGDKMKDMSDTTRKNIEAAKRFLESED